ncbi:hypothetical protein HUW63_24100 [Myxococcus sp. AM001]|uniref:hypothetical protein n=1 Tax=Myxococcus vastator TaxID=2709664 RepID=UPI0013D74E22|nr:hypothetical protein [Myxococcus vastator]NVJ08308.1 hypothetical protein [Myxococcus sp. AM001]
MGTRGHQDSHLILVATRLIRYIAQFNLQVFRNLDFIEDHGRGGISFGKCELTAP